MVSTVDSVERAVFPTQASASAPAQATSIWSEDYPRRGKITKRRVLIAGAVAVCATVAVVLFITLSKSSGGSSLGALAQASDSNSLGCFADERNDRIFPYVFRDETGMTPTLCNAQCGEEGYSYYALQWGQECWCGGSSVNIVRHGESDDCDYPCPGDSEMICGGYLAFTAYEVGVKAATPITSTTSCSGAAADITIEDDVVFITGGGCATLTDIYNAEGSSDLLFVLDKSDSVVARGTPTGRWLLAADVRIHGGSTLHVHGLSVNGDCDVLRIKSDGSSSYYEVRGHGGNLSFKGTKVTSWDTDSGEEQTTHSGGRSFINCISEELAGDDCDGSAQNDMGECRMDIIDSVMGNMGFFDVESYGLTWKVRGFCEDLSNPKVFERTGVYGDIQGSEIYGMYYGMYSYGHQDGVWTNNIMRDNIVYGFDPHDDSDDLIIANNKVYGNGNHGIIASKRCDNLKIYDNEVYDGGKNAVGIFLHRSSDDAEVYNNYVHDMQGAGVALMESMNADVHDNIMENVMYGVRLSVGSAGSNIYDNTFDSCTDAGIHTYEGRDEPWASDGRPSENTFDNNIISNTEVGVNLRHGDSNVFTNNVFTETEVFGFEDSTDTTWSGNSIPSGACVSEEAEFTSDSDAIPPC